MLRGSPPGLAAGLASRRGALAAALGLLADDAGAKKRGKRKWRCKRRFAPCTPGGKRKCCNTLACQVPFDLQDGASTDTRCCYRGGYSPCQVDNDCCYPAFCSGPGGECVVNSDRALKANFATVDPVVMLARVAALPITIWKPIPGDAASRHIGPTTRDFTALFGVGTAGQSIHPVDGQGVALAAIQGLAGLVEELRGARPARGAGLHARGRKMIALGQATGSGLKAARVTVQT